MQFHSAVPNWKQPKCPVTVEQANILLQYHPTSEIYSAMTNNELQWEKSLWEILTCFRAKGHKSQMNIYGMALSVRRSNISKSFWYCLGIHKYKSKVPDFKIWALLCGVGRCRGESWGQEEDIGFSKVLLTFYIWWWIYRYPVSLYRTDIIHTKIFGKPIILDLKDMNTTTPFR